MTTSTDDHASYVIVAPDEAQDAADATKLEDFWEASPRAQQTRA